MNVAQGAHLLGALDSPVAPLVRAVARARPARIGYAMETPAPGDAEVPGGAAVCISLDFELAWAKWHGMRPLARYYAREGRRNVPGVLDDLRRARAPATWATVGHLYLERCGREAGRPHPDLPRPGPYRSTTWSFAGGDWYDGDPCASWAEAPEWYAPDLVDAVRDDPAGHEMACHGFSHTSLGDAHATRDLVEAEVRATARAMRERGLALRSVVFPGNHEGHHDALAKAGIVAYRGAARGDAVARPRRHAAGPWDVHQTMQLLGDGREAQRLAVALRALDDAERHGAVAHFWGHPEEMNERMRRLLLRPLLAEVAKRRDAGRLRVATMAALADEMEGAR